MPTKRLTPSLSNPKIFLVLLVHYEILWTIINRVRTSLNSGATAALLQKIFRPIVCSLVMTSLSMTEAKLFFVKDSYADRLIIYSLPKDNLNRYVSLTKNCFVISIPHSMYPMVVFIFNTQFWCEHMESWVFSKSHNFFIMEQWPVSEIF